MALVEAVALEANVRPQTAPAWEFSYTSYFRTLTT